MWIPKDAALIRGRSLLEESGISFNNILKEQTCDFKFQIIDDATMSFLPFSISQKIGE